MHHDVLYVCSNWNTIKSCIYTLYINNKNILYIYVIYGWLIVEVGGSATFLKRTLCTKWVEVADLEGQRGLTLHLAGQDMREVVAEDFWANCGNFYYLNHPRVSNFWSLGLFLVVKGLKFHSSKASLDALGRLAWCIFHGPILEQAILCNDTVSKLC